MIRHRELEGLSSQRYLLAAALSAGVLFFGVARPAHAGLFSSMSEKDEIKAGQQVAAQSIKQYGGVLPPDDPRSIRVRTIGMQFAALSSRKSIPYTYQVLNNDKVLNAFAAPGGPVFITKKLLETAANDAELAYVLGHETTHIDHKHIVKMVEKQQKVGLLAGLAAALLGRGGNADAVNAIGSIGLQAWQSGYSRKDENDADLGGIRFMAQLGYDPGAAITMLGKLGDGPDNPLQRITADHPASSERQRTVQFEINKENLVEVARQHGGPRLGSNPQYGAGYDNNRPEQNPAPPNPATPPAAPDGPNNYPDYGSQELHHTAPAGR